LSALAETIARARERVEAESLKLRGNRRTKLQWILRTDRRAIHFRRVRRSRDRNKGVAIASVPREPNYARDMEVMDSTIVAFDNCEQSCSGIGKTLGDQDRTWISERNDGKWKLFASIRFYLRESKAGDSISRLRCRREITSCLRGIIQRNKLNGTRRELRKRFELTAEDENGRAAGRGRREMADRIGAGSGLEETERAEITYRIEIRFTAIASP